MTYRSILAGVATAGVLLAAPLAIAGTGDDLREGVRNPSSGDATRETQIIARSGKDTYGTRQSNLGEGGGAIYGCRSTLAPNFADPKQSTPCLRINNLRSGKAFDFVADTSRIVGIIQSGSSIATPKPNVAPFVTNANGLAVGLNADRIDGLQASELATLARTKNGLDADTVDGLDSAALVSGGACPSGTVAAGGGCLETAARAAASFAAASRTCGDASRRLAAPDVLIAAARADAINLVGGELSADLSVTPGVGGLAATPAVTTVAESGAISTVEQNTTAAYRCYIA